MQDLKVLPSDMKALPRECDCELAHVHRPPIVESCRFIITESKMLLDLVGKGMLAAQVVSITALQ